MKEAGGWIKKWITKRKRMKRAKTDEKGSVVPDWKGDMIYTHVVVDFLVFSFTFIVRNDFLTYSSSSSSSSWTRFYPKQHLF